MAKLVKCPACGKTKVMKHAKVRGFRCCFLEHSVSKHVVVEGRGRKHRPVYKKLEDIEV